MAISGASQGVGKLAADWPLKSIPAAPAQEWGPEAIVLAYEFRAATVATERGSWYKSSQPRGLFSAPDRRATSLPLRGHFLC